ncbi:MAG: response regulator [Halobacteriaceae archaeon]
MAPNSVVLIVEDERGLAHLYADWLGAPHTVRVAYDGASALEQLDDEVDVVLLDRRMPGLSGDAVLDEIRDRELGCRVAMVTAVDPDFDVVDMGFDDYVVKPVDQADLTDLVDRLLSLRDYDEELTTFYQLASKVAALETAKTEDELADSEEYQRLTDELERRRESVDASFQSVADFDTKTLIDTDGDS